MEGKLGTVTAYGVVLDIGSGGSGNVTLLQSTERTRVFSVDIRPEGKPSFLADIEHGIPLRSASVDVVLLLNVLEHVYSFAGVIRDVGRIMRPGGLLYLYVPFLYPRHTARYGAFIVEDYFRYGPHTLERLLREVGGFSGPIHMEPCGYGPFTAALSMTGSVIPFNRMRAFAHRLGLWCDQIFFAWQVDQGGAVAVSEWPIAYWMKAEK